MRIVATSNGLEWDGDGSAYLDAIPAPTGRSPQPLTLEQVVAAARAEGSAPTVWHRWTPDMSPHHNLKVFAGAIGINQSVGLALRYIYKRGTQPADGLYAIEERDHLPAAVAGAVLAAVTTDLPQPPTSANVLPALVARYVDNINVEDPPRPRRINRAEIEQGLAGYVASLVSGRQVALPIGGVNRARYVLAQAQAMWQHDTMRRLGAVSDLERLREANELAVTWREMRPDLTVRLGKADVRPAAVVAGSPWMEMLAWVYRSIPADAARFFGSLRPTDASWALTTKLPQLDALYADAIAAGLIREARERQVYAATGQFVLALPEHLPWREAGIVALAIHAQADGLWVAGVTARNERTASWWWDPGMTTATINQHTIGAQPLAHVTLAAFWHDLVVAGDEVIVPAGVRPRPVSVQPGRPRRGASAMVLPRRSIHYSGHREWGTAEERDIITRRSHGVRGHLRELPEGWQRSEAAEGEAREWGFVLPEGYTFVRPHVRGGHDHDPAPIVARARGLQTLSALICG